MSSTSEKLIEQVLHLPKETRAFLAEKLLETLDFEESFSVSKEWQSEIGRRCKEMDEGRVKLHPALEVFEDIKKRLK